MKKYIRLRSTDPHKADELALALLHSGFKVRIETEATQFGHIPLLVCFYENKIEVINRKEED